MVERFVKVKRGKNGPYHAKVDRWGVTRIWNEKFSYWELHDLSPAQLRYVRRKAMPR